MNCLILFFTFAKFGVLCFGGGYMLIPLMIAEFVGQGKLLQAEQFGNLVSVSQLTPGPVGINVATFIGCIDGGVAGALAGTLGLVFPTLLLAGVAVSLIRRYQETAFLQGLLYGARLAAVSLICFAVMVFLELSVFVKGIPWRGWFDALVKRSAGMPEFAISFSGVFILILSVVMIKKFKMSTTWVILISGGLGALFKVLF